VETSELAIMNRIVAVVTPVLCRLGADPDLCDEIVQQAAIRLWERGYWTLTTEPQFIRTVARNLFRDHHRHRKFMNLGDNPTIEQIPTRDGDPTDVLADSASDLTSRYCPTIGLAPEILNGIVDGDHCSDIARRLRVPAGSIRRQLHDIRKQLRPVLA
jgi:DNA-directed RNA polymerase specialized sigma24 family protein